MKRSILAITAAVVVAGCGDSPTAVPEGPLFSEAVPEGPLLSEAVPALTVAVSGPAAPIELAAGGVLVPITVTFDGGPADLSVACGNGRVVTADDVGSPHALACLYTGLGVHAVTATVTDRDGNTGEGLFQYVVVYDPSAGFVTGGGWIDSPAGAFAADASLEGKATFGFVSRYKKGANTPQGNTEFQFKAGSLHFKSTSYQWLVVAGARAQFKGEGTIDGDGHYDFMLTAVDGQLPGGGGADRFRIKISDHETGAPVYDNRAGESDGADPATALGGGSIVIHGGGGKEESNTAPLADDDAYLTDEDVELVVPAPGVLDGDTDPEAQALTALLEVGPAHGTLALNADGSFTYTPDPDFHGSDAFTYRAYDGLSDSNVATVTITVDAVNDTPQAEDEAYGTNEDVQLSVAALDGVIVNDSDPEGDALSAVLVAGPAHGTLALNADGSFTYTPDADFNGSDAFTYYASDGTDVSNVATATITVTPVNDAPSFTPGSDQTAGDADPRTVAGWATAISAGPADEAGQSLQFQVTVDDASLFAVSPSVSPDGTLSYTPATAVNGVATVTVVLKDDGGTGNGGADTSAEETFTITVEVPVSNEIDSGLFGQDTPVNEGDPGILELVTVSDFPVHLSNLRVTVPDGWEIISVEEVPVEAPRGCPEDGGEGLDRCRQRWKVVLDPVTACTFDGSYEWTWDVGVAPGGDPDLVDPSFTSYSTVTLLESENFCEVGGVDGGT